MVGYKTCFCPLHEQHEQILTKLQERTLLLEVTMASMEKRIAVIRKDIMDVVVDLQKALVEATEKLGQAAEAMKLSDATVKALAKGRTP